MSADRRPVIIIGAGAGGLAAALRLAEAGVPAMIVVKGALGDGSTAWAQGGLAAVSDPADSLAAHAADTIAAGAGLCDPDAVAALVAAAPAAIDRLAALGARFDAGPRGYALGLEGGHGARRIVHAGGDASGAEVAATLAAAARRAVDRGALEVRVAMVTDLLRDRAGAVAGVRTLDRRGRREVLAARAVVLATGGIGRVYAASTNPDTATGDGLALAARVGAVINDAEFVQFHPTGLAVPGERVALISEAVRGEGARLIGVDGRSITAGVHPLGDLAPRDVVAAAIHRELINSGADHVLLDATMIADFDEHFPGIAAACRAAGIDPVSEPIPVRPVEHYHCGGVRADLRGRTGIPGLYAVGEVAGTGVHGANRLASNSLTEALVAGAAAGRLLAAGVPAPGDPVDPPPTELLDPGARTAIGAAMSRGAGLLRDADGLRSLGGELARIGARATGRVSIAAAEAANLHLVARLIATAAANRTESRGCHRRADHPAPVERWQRHQSLVLGPDGSFAGPSREVAA
ncbi:L-aspartate oxidase [Naumannella cuiyingiana]|uniref:L-aspartate oxidase n=1 Tax=Naumannella cuiyingiana TaxID=1347891 RepID=A0A7Z0IKS3_9ACTN|nr:L-aspartate oxidase [Naumannella cuiyingiana]NYI70818.1 L-aspartate oxidase [Naumannella cuiyingiana]